MYYICIQVCKDRGSITVNVAQLENNSSTLLQSQQDFSSFKNSAEFGNAQTQRPWTRKRFLDIGLI